MPSSTGQKKPLISLENVVSIDLATFSEPTRGTLTVVQSNQDIPFSIARIFYIYGVPNDRERGAHAHREAEQAFIAVSGSFSLEVSNASQSKTFAMKEPNRAVYVPPMIWARVCNFSEGAVCLVLAGAPYDPADYIRDWNEFVSAIGGTS
jgi:dTDP-4-dehydrorhamnose 3,5-epimerase-like enzyme